MIVDIQNDRFMIVDLEHSLDAIVKSQLSFWEFKYDYSTHTYTNALDQQLFLRTLKYFDQENYSYTLTEKAKEYSEKLQVLTLGFDNQKRLAAEFKNGNFDQLMFDQFTNFINNSVYRSLKSHQVKAAFHLYLLGNAANFSVPGSGKTSVVLTVYEKLRTEGKVNTLFVVGPPACFGPWKNEFVETLNRRPSHMVLAGGNKLNRKDRYREAFSDKVELYLTSFQSLLSDQNEILHFLSQKNLHSFFVVDEAHYIKQIKGNWARAILKLSEKAKFRCVLTGTPMPKSYTDIFNLFDFLWPNRHPIPANDKTLIKYNEERGNRHSVKNILDSDIGPLFYRVRKSDLKLTPQVFNEPFMIEMNPYERLIYDSIYKRIKDFSKEDYFKNIAFINKLGRGRIMRLRQSISYPKLLTTAIDEYDERLIDDLSDLKNVIRQYDRIEVPAKIEFLLDKVRVLSANNSKVVIWSNFIGTIKLIEKHLKAHGFNCKKIYGSTPVEGTIVKDEETREKIRDEFVDPSSGLDILIANPAACSESISLHKTCHHAFYYDLTYNCAQYLQSLDRIHRVGGSEFIEANYYFMQYNRTIDSDIKANLDLKTKKMFEVIEEHYPIYSLNMFEPDGDMEAYHRLFKKKSRTRK